MSLQDLPEDVLSIILRLACIYPDKIRRLQYESNVTTSIYVPEVMPTPPAPGLVDASIRSVSKAFKALFDTAVPVFRWRGEIQTFLSASVASFVPTTIEKDDFCVKTRFDQLVEHSSLDTVSGLGTGRRGRHAATQLLEELRGAVIDPILHEELIKRTLKSHSACERHFGPQLAHTISNVPSLADHIHVEAIASYGGYSFPDGTHSAAKSRAQIVVEIPRDSGAEHLELAITANRAVSDRYGTLNSMYLLDVTSANHVTILEPLLCCPDRLADEEIVTHFRNVTGNFCRLFYTNHDHYILTHLFESEALDKLKEILSPLIHFSDNEQMLSFFFALIGTPRNIIELDTFFFTSSLRLPLDSKQPLGRIEEADPPQQFSVWIPSLYRIPSARNHVNDFRQLIQSLNSIPFLEPDLLAVAKCCIDDVKIGPTRQRFLANFDLDSDPDESPKQPTDKFSVGLLLDQLFVETPRHTRFDVAQLAKKSLSIICGSKADLGVGMYDDQSPHTLLFSIRLPEVEASPILIHGLYRYGRPVAHVWDAEMSCWRRLSVSTADPKDAVIRSCFPDIKSTLFYIALFLTALSTP